MGSEGLSNVIRARGTVRLEGQDRRWHGPVFPGGSPAGTGSGLAMGMASNTSSLYAVHITGTDAAGITNAHGTFDRIELDDTTQDPNFLGFTGSGLKAINEVEVRNSYIHDNQGNGLWCDVYRRDSADHPNGFWVHENLVVDNGRAGIRFEQVGCYRLWRGAHREQRGARQLYRCGTWRCEYTMRRTRWCATTCSERRSSPTLRTYPILRAWRYARRTAVGRTGPTFGTRTSWVTS